MIVIYIDGDSNFNGNDEALASDVIYHGYTHFIINEIYGGTDIGSGPNPFKGDAMDEGLSDYFAATFTGDPHIFEYVGTSLGSYRDLNNDLEYVVGETKWRNGQVIGGALWDVRQAIGTDKTDRLVIEALQIEPRPYNFADLGYNMLLADQNFYSANHESDIKSAFSSHGITIPALPPLSASISGPSSLDLGGNGTWYASAAGGRQGYSYGWEYKVDYGNCGPTLQGSDVGTNEIDQCGGWASDGTGSSYSRSAGFQDGELHLRLTVTDNKNNTDQTTRTVTLGDGLQFSKESEGEPVLAATLTSAPDDFTLKGAAPNPMRNRSTIRYGLPEEASASITVYDAMGRQVTQLADGAQQAGWYTVQFEAADLPSGVYLVRMNAGDHFTMTKRLVVAR